jgi:hypothetical protein
MPALPFSALWNFNIVEMRDKNDGKSLHVFAHISVELPKLVEKLTSLLCDC